MLKKVICLLLVLAFSAALFACGGNGTTANTNTPADNAENENAGGNEKPNDEKGNEEQRDPEFVGDETTVNSANDQLFFSIVNSSLPNVIVTKTTTTNSKLGDCNGFYTTTIFGEGNYVFEYEYERFNSLGASSMKETVGPHTIYFKDGTYAFDSEDNVVYAHPDPDVIDVRLDLSKQYLGSYTLSTDGTKLTAKVNAENASKILGISIVAKGDVTLTVETDGTHLWKIIVDYAYDASNTIHIETSYTYENISANAG